MMTLALNLAKCSGHSLPDLLMRLNATPPPKTSSSEPTPQSVARRSTMMFLLFWLVVMGLMYLAMQHFLKPAQAKVQADGSVRIERGVDGHFRAKGYVNGQAVTFLVDTGASSVSVTDELAAKAGLEGARKPAFVRPMASVMVASWWPMRCAWPAWWYAMCEWARAIPAMTATMHCWDRIFCVTSMCR